MYHLKNEDVKKCSAKKCRTGGEHYETEEQAHKALEQKLNEEFGSSFGGYPPQRGKKPKKTDKTLADYFEYDDGEAVGFTADFWEE